MTETNLKGSTCSKASLLLNDYIYHSDSIYKCVNRPKLLFEEIGTKKRIALNKPSYWRL